MINNIGIRNFTSFDDKGVFLEGLSKVNVIIGKNNNGKSNVLRFLLLLSTNYINLDLGVLSKPLNLNKISGQAIKLGFDISFKELNWPDNITESQYDRDTVALNNYLPNPFRIWMTLINEKVQTEDMPEAFSNFSDHVFKQLHKLNRSASLETNLETIRTNINSVINQKLESLKNLIYIPELRVINPSDSHSSGNSEINGKNIITKMFIMQNPNVGDEHQRKIFDKI